MPRTVNLPLRVVVFHSLVLGYSGGGQSVNEKGRAWYEKNHNKGPPWQSVAALFDGCKRKFDGKRLNLVPWDPIIPLEACVTSHSALFFRFSDTDIGPIWRDSTMTSSRILSHYSKLSIARLRKRDIHLTISSCVVALPAIAGFGIPFLAKSSPDTLDWNAEKL